MSIVLVFLVLLVLVTVLMELRFNASVEMDRAYAIVDNATMGRLADAAARQGEAALLMDSEAAKAEEDTGGSADGAAGPDGANPLLDDGGGEADDTAAGGVDAASKAASIAETTASTDSRLDDWMDSAALAPALGNDWSLCTEIEDEDSKINLLGLWTGDQDLRQEQHDIVRDLLDKAFEGSSRDISFSDANDLLDKLGDWVKGQRGSFDPIPKPTLKKTNEQDKAAEDGGTLDTSVMDTGESNYPLTLGELLMLPDTGLRPEHMSGFVEDDKYYPGLESYLTLYSQLELKTKPKEGDNLYGDSPFTKGSLFDQTNPGMDTGKPGGGDPKQDPKKGDDNSTADAGAGGDAGGSGDAPSMEDEDFQPTPTNDGLVNVNTAPLAVLRALAPTEIPVSFLEKVVEYRNKIDELKRDQGLGGVGSLFDTAKGGTADDKSGAGDEPETGFGKNEDEDITEYVFKTPQEALDKVQEEYGFELNLDPGIESKFTSRLTVTSQVFTIKVLVYKLAQNPTTSREEFQRHGNWRTVVWRMLGDSVPHTMTLLPLEEYHDPRRLKDYPGDLQQLASDHSQAVSSAGTGR